MDLVQRSFADAEHERPALLEGHIGGALNEARCSSVGNAAQRSDAAGDDDHGIGRIRPAGNVRSDIAVGLLLNLCRGRADDLMEQVGAAFDAEFLGHDAQGAVRSDEVYRLHPCIAFDGK